jgi:hypothetical protein
MDKQIAEHDSQTQQLNQRSMIGHELHFSAVGSEKQAPP